MINIKNEDIKYMLKHKQIKHQYKMLKCNE